MKKLFGPLAVLVATIAHLSSAENPANASVPLLDTKGARIELSRDQTDTIFILTGFDQSGIQAFEVPDPSRIVVDIPAGPTRLPKGKQDLHSPCATAARFGAHVGKIRLVLDMTATPCTFKEEKGGDSYRLVVTPSTRTPEPASAATKIPEPVATAVSEPTPAATSTPIPPAASEVEPTATAEIEPTPVSKTEPTAVTEVEPTRASTAAPANTLPAQTAGNLLTGIVFTHEDEQPVVRLELNQRTNFKR